MTQWEKNDRERRNGKDESTRNEWRGTASCLPYSALLPPLTTCVASCLLNRTLEAATLSRGANVNIPQTIHSTSPILQPKMAASVDTIEAKVSRQEIRRLCWLTDLLSTVQEFWVYPKQLNPSDGKVLLSLRIPPVWYCRWSFSSGNIKCLLLSLLSKLLTLMLSLIDESGYLVRKDENN